MGLLEALAITAPAEHGLTFVPLRESDGQRAESARGAQQPAPAAKRV